MPSKIDIFDNIATYTPDQIVKFIREGIVSVLELEDSENTNGEYSNDMRDRVNSLLQDNEPADWQKALETDTVEGYQCYLDTYNDGKHRDEARQRKKELLNPTTPHKNDIPPATGSDSLVEKLPELMAFMEQDPDNPIILNYLNEADRFIVNHTEDKSLLEEYQVAFENFNALHPNNPNKVRIQRLINKIINLRDIWIDMDMTALIREVKNIQADKNVLNSAETIFNVIVQNIEEDNDINLENVVDAIAKDKNWLGAKVIYKLYNEGYLTKEDFKAMNVNKQFIQHMLQKIPPQTFDVPAPLTQISRPSTEIYFWGIPSSGKSCALGGILSVANNGRVASHMRKDSRCQGYGYMSRLMLLFANDGNVGTLPEGTQTTATYEMGFDLTDNDGKIHPITCIDLAGEMIRCMFKFDSGDDLDDSELKTLDTLTKLLVNNRTQNRKMHFFVIEYGADDRLYEGLPQRTYLEAAVEYIRNFEIFKNNTDAIFVLVTKVDMAPDTAPRNQVVAEYLDRNYKGFINGLKSICKENDINEGVIEIIPFSLGTVCFRDYCLFDEKAAELVVKRIIQNTKGFSQDKLNKFIGKLKG